jgi:hypothetical protein
VASGSLVSAPPDTTRNVEPAGRSTLERSDLLWLGACVVIGLGLRLWAIDFGLPSERARPDERHLIGYALTIGGNGLNPGFFRYPNFYLYVLFAVYAVYLGLGLATGHFASSTDLVREYAIAPTPLYVIDRVLVALIGTATIVLVYWLGKRAGGRFAGRLSALFLSVAYLHVRDSHFGTVDVPTGFMATLAVVMIVKAYDSRTTKSYLVAGVVSGLAVSTKYNALALAAPLGALLLAPEVRRTLPSLPRWLGAVGLVALAVVVGFLLGTPFALFDSSTFVHDVGAELFGKMGRSPRVDRGPGWLYHLSVTLPIGVGLPMLLLSALGMIDKLRENVWRGLVLVGFPLAWFAGTGFSRMGYVRYCVPMVPLLCVCAALGADWLRRTLDSSLRARSIDARAGRAVMTAVVALAVIVPLYRVAAWNYLVGQTDTRVLAKDWIERHLPAGTSLGSVASNYVRPQLWSTIAQMERVDEGHNVRNRNLRAQIEIDHVKKTGAPTYEVYEFDSGRFRDALTPALHPQEPPDCLVLPEHPLIDLLEIRVPKLTDEYSVKARFEGVSAASPDAIYDVWDAFFLPYTGFTGVTRPGPNLLVACRN